LSCGELDELDLDLIVAEPSVLLRDSAAAILDRLERGVATTSDNFETRLNESFE